MNDPELVNHVALELSSARYLRALWGGPFLVRFTHKRQIVRSAFDGREQVMPPVFAGPSLLHARAAHAAAHAEFSGERCAVGSLKPLQQVLVSLFEDARVEALSIERYPGLRRLWAPFHTAAPNSGPAPLAALLARLSRALFDGDYADPETWIQKARRSFLEGRAASCSPELSRRLGSLLGNELGQMRLSLDARQYVVEPAYRDDHSGLWLEPPNPAAQTPTSSGASVTPDNPPPRGPAEHLYPEWDYVIARQRPDFCELRDERPLASGTVNAHARTAQARRVQQRLERALVAATYQRRCSDGPMLDLAAVVDAAAEQAAERPSTWRVYQRPKRRRRRSSALVLLDLSESSNANVAQGMPGRELASAAAGLLCVAGARGLELAIHGFSSYGRRDVRYTRFKDFSEPGAVALPRLVNLQACGSTRLGPALRHASALLKTQAGAPRLLLVITDGDPADVDVYDPSYLVEDARQAVEAARKAGIFVFACCLPGGPPHAQRRIFGQLRGPLARPTDLAAHLGRACSDLLGGRR